MVYTKTKTFRKNKFVFEPLFRSDCICAGFAGRNTDHETNKWGYQPAVLAWKTGCDRWREINAIREFTENYRNIRIEPTSVNNEEEVNNFNGSSSIEGKLYAVKQNRYGLKLPSLGYYLTAELEEESILNKRSRQYKTSDSPIRNEKTDKIYVAGHSRMVGSRRS